MTEGEHCCYLLYWRKGLGLTGGDRRGVLLLFIVLEKEPGLTGGDQRGALLLFIVLEEGTGFNRR